MGVLKRKNKITRELMGLSALNQFSPHNSSSRGVMFLSQLSQYLSLVKPETRILLSGLEEEMLGGSMNIELPENSRILNIIPYTVDEKILNVYIVYHDMNNNVIDLLIVKTYGKNDRIFGYRHEWTDALKNMNEDDVYKKKIKLTKTNSETEDGVHGFGVNANIAWITDPKISDDAIVISESLSKRLSYRWYETKVFEFGRNYVPTNIYGDRNNYKIIPDVGERVGDDGVIANLRKVDDLTYPALFSKKALSNIDPTFDHCYYSRGSNGVVVDIDVLYSPNNSKTMGYSNTYDQVKKYSDAKQRQRKELIDAVQYIEKSFPNVRIGNTLHVEATNAMTIENPRVTKVYNRENLDISSLLIFNTISFGFKPAFSDGEPFNGDTTVTNPLIFSTSIPIPKNSLSTSSLNSLFSTGGKKSV